MLTKIKTLILSIATLLFFAVAPMAIAHAADCGGANQPACSANPQNAVCSGATNLTIPTGAPSSGSCPTGDTATNSVNSIITTILNILSVVVGIIAVIMIIVGGFHYITSGGSQEKVKKAKETLLYAIIGLVIVALAQVIVNFVLHKATA